MNDLNGSMELHHLRCVVAIADHGTFTEAAAALHVSQPALSHAVARLEREVGSRLFERSPARTRLTEAGRALLGPARRALAEADNGLVAVAAVAGLLSGELRLTGVRTAVVETAQLVVEFHRRHPGVYVVIDEPTGDSGVIEAVRGALCDVGIIHSTEKTADLPGVRAGAQEIVAVFPQALAPATERVTMDYLSDVPFVAPAGGTGIRAAYDAFFGDRARRPPIVAECSDQSMLIELVRSGLGAAISSASRVAALDSDGLAVRPIRPRMRTELTAIRRRHASPAANAFCRMLASPALP